MRMKLTAIESPYAGDVERNLRYVRACMKDCFHRGEAPYASHALYPQFGVLDDNNPEERQLGMEAGKCWEGYADITAVYVDLGVSAGMLWGIKNAALNDRPVVWRRLGPGWDK